MKILTLYDGTLQSKTALQYGLRKVKEKSGELIVLQSFEAALFLDYDAGPGAEEVARAEAARFRRDAEAIISAAEYRDIPMRYRYEEGDMVEEAVRVAEEEKPDLILSSPRHKALAKRFRWPVYIMPGTILVPVDNSEALNTNLETIAAEARATGSNVLLLGVVPVHLYSAAEKEELDQIRESTASRVRKMKKSLNESGIETADAVCSGYPDEEILKVAEEQPVSLIMLPSGGKTPSELTKAAAMLLEDSAASGRPPIYLLQMTGP